MFSRRDFIKQGLIPVFAGSAVPSVFANGVAAAAADSPNAAPSDRILVLVQLAGGNDGLNTVIPFSDGAYHDARPTLRQDQGVLPLNSQLGLHPNLKGLKASFDAGQLAIVQGVGYPSPNLSHFASMSIWETANVNSGIGDGWLGRYLNYLDKVGESPNHALEGVSAGSLVPPELRSTTPVTALQSLKTFRLQPVNEHGTQVDVENPLMKFYGAFKGSGPWRRPPTRRRARSRPGSSWWRRRSSPGWAYASRTSPWAVSTTTLARSQSMTSSCSTSTRRWPLSCRTWRVMGMATRCS